ncbi:MAG: 1-deoxy-D-xylulose-5-phosphate synthase [Candidatus Hydrogenedentota bacterium]|nr:MAG: 1-deoxy-D-xylulose-5-phosphate synthase [Candidatus Hydrogenedentota bacterium]
MLISDEIRNFLLNTLSQTGGHLASNLGTVELTVALHYVFDSPKDRFCWDVGHQTYVHKILTGRKDDLKSVRQWKGISGFPKQSESKHDLYETGHAGTSISQALGEAVARDTLIKQNPNKDLYDVIAIIGDASMGCGMAFEAMNHAGHTQNPFLVILNDNEMSISPNVGALSYSLNRLIASRYYRKSRRRIMKFLLWLPVIGPIVLRWLLRFGNSMKTLLIDNAFFEELGFRYIGPQDGHNVIGLVKIFRQLKGLNEPTVLHVVTKKGKGYNPAEADPVKYHGVKPFETKSGKMVTSADRYSFSKYAGKVLIHIAKKDKKLVAITPAMKEGSGLTEFADLFPERFHDVGIAEQHATAFAGALARSGLHPYLCIYSTFLQRGYDQLIQDIVLMNLPVKILLDRAGCVGGDGETHQGIYDIAYMLPLPNIRILSANNPKELSWMMLTTKKDKMPVSIRYPRKDFPASFLEDKDFFKPPKNYSPYQSEILRKGKDILILAEGSMVDNALSAANFLSEKGIDAEVLSLKSIKPLDTKTIKKALQGKKACFCVENHCVIGGVGSFIRDTLAEELSGIHYQHFGYPDIPIPHGTISKVEDFFGLSGKKLATEMEKIINKKVFKYSKYGA